MAYVYDAANAYWENENNLSHEQQDPGAGAGVPAPCDDEKIGSLMLEGGRVGAEIWAYFEGDETFLEFQGWRSDGSWWSVSCNVDERIDTTLKTICLVGEDLGALVDYIRITSINYTKDMPDQTITRDATLNQCMDFPDQRWVDIRDQDQWYNVHMVVRRC